MYIMCMYRCNYTIYIYTSSIHILHMYVYIIWCGALPACADRGCGLRLRYRLYSLKKNPMYIYIYMRYIYIYIL